VEIGEPAADAARARGLDVRTGTLDQLAPTLDGPFDLITFWDVLEHLPEPVGALRLARSLLAPGGRVAMTFPNVEGWYPRATHRLIARPTGVWEHPELPVHLYDFSPATARRLAREGGLEVERARTTEIPFGFLRDSTLVPQLALSRKRRLVLGPAFGLLRRAIYPAARLMGRGNAQFLLAKG
jgi:SAM-dependent methyltransferase